jgi:hypothetical protein
VEAEAGAAPGALLDEGSGGERRAPQPEAIAGSERLHCTGLGSARPPRGRRGGRACLKYTLNFECARPVRDGRLRHASPPPPSPRY